MKEKTKLKFLFYFTVAYLFVFTAIAVLNRNFEFLYYTVILSILLLIAVLYHKQLHLPTSILTGLTIIGLMHVLGGNLHPMGVRLYDFWLIENFIKYDNVVHFVGTFMITLVSYSLLFPHLDKKFEHNKTLLAMLLIGISMGIASINEILELGAVVFFGATDQVGDYMNNALDLFFNLLGSLTAIFFLLWHYKKR